MYAALVEGLDPEQRAELNARLSEPLGEQAEEQDAAFAEWRRANGW